MAKKNKANKLPPMKKGFGQIEMERLTPADWNYKDMDSPSYSKLKEKLTNNIKRNGQIENILIRELDTGFYEVVNGNHRYEVMKELGYETAQAYNLGKVEQSVAERIAVETNETKFETDNLKLAKLLKGLQESYSIDELCNTLPYEVSEMEDFNKLLDFEWSELGDPELKPKPDAEDEDWKVVRLNLPLEVAEQFEAQVDRFKQLLNPEAEELKDISIVFPVEAMIQSLAQIPDKNILGDK